MPSRRKPQPDAALSTADIDKLLGLVDDMQIATGAPVLSVMVFSERTGKVTPAFWRSVEKHGLRREGESDDALIDRSIGAAIAFYRDPSTRRRH